MLPVQTILHPTDFSIHSDLALQVACSLARDHGARLVVLHVAHRPVVMYDEKGSLLPQPKDYREAATKSLAMLRATDTRICIEPRVEEGETSATILRLAQEIKADLIVLGTHGRRGLDRLVIGSIAEDVLRKAPCSVLAVKAAPSNALAVGCAEVQEPAKVS